MGDGIKWRQMRLGRNRTRCRVAPTYCRWSIGEATKGFSVVILLYLFIFSVTLPSIWEVGSSHSQLVLPQCSRAAKLVPTNSCQPHQPSRWPTVLFYCWSEDLKSILIVHGFFVFSVLVSIRFAEVFEIARESVCNSSAFNSPVAVAPFGHSVSSSTHLMMANPIFLRYTSYF